MLVRLRLAVAASLLLLGSSMPRPARPTIVLVSVDTLRADHLGCYGGRDGTSPFIDEMAERGTLFENDVVPMPLTGPSHASLLTGRSPWKHGVGVNGVAITTGVDSLPAALQRAGYYTAGAVAVSHLGRACGFARGFDSFSDPDYAVRMNDNRRDSGSVNAAAEAAVDIYRKDHKSQPLFLFVHYFDCHAPYGWWNATKSASNDACETRYDDGIRHVDSAIRQLHTYLDARGLLENAIFIVTADHGEQLGDHGLSCEHGDLYRETVRVPLIVTGTGFPRRRVAEVVSSMDVAPTLARIGGGTLAGGSDGLDLQPAIDRAGHRGLGWFEGPRRRRSFVVQGAPNYTRSLAMIDGDRWFIKNYDFVYRDSWIVTPAPAGDHPRSPAKETERAADKVVYRLPVREYQPHMITIEHVAADPNCAATASIKALPTARYFDAPIPFRGSIRVVVPSARLDSVALIVEPPSCAGHTFYSVARPGEATVPPAPPRVTDLFTHLLVERKTHRGDELYDVATDPAMLHPIPNAREIAERSRELADRFREIAAGDPANLTISPEQQRLLRSMGYIQ